MVESEVSQTAAEERFFELATSLQEKGSVGLTQPEMEEVRQLPLDLRVIMDSLLGPAVEIDGKKYDSKTAAVLVAFYGKVDDPETARLAKAFWHETEEGDHRPLGEQLESKIPKKLLAEYHELCNKYLKPGNLEQYGGSCESKKNQDIFYNLTGALNDFKGKLKKEGYAEAAKIVDFSVHRVSDSRTYRPSTCRRAVINY